MFKWLKLYNDASPKTKSFVLNWMIYGLTIIVTAIYCYARLDFVRSYRTPAAIEADQKSKKNTESTQKKIENIDDTRKP
ncbi:MAG: hypothetical protein WCG42_00700 [Parachlamydiaceae bacterium]